MGHRQTKTKEYPPVSLQNDDKQKAFDKIKKARDKKIRKLVNQIHQKHTTKKAPIASLKEQNISSTSKQKIILVTDFGSNADEALGLLTLLNLPKDAIELLGIIVVYGQTAIREKTLKCFLKFCNKDIPVIEGTSKPLGTVFPYWSTQKEGCGFLSEEEIAKLKGKIEHGDQLFLVSEKNAMKSRIQENNLAADYIITQVEKYPGEIVIIAVGAMSDIALALYKKPEIGKSIKRICFMGCGVGFGDMEIGEVFTTPATYKVSEDVLAAKYVFDSGVPVQVICSSLARQELLLDEEPVKKILAIAEKLNGDISKFDQLDNLGVPKPLIAVSILVKYWLEYRSSIKGMDIKNIIPHNPFTCIEAVEPGKFASYVRGHFLVHLENGSSTFIVDPDGPHYATVSLKSKQFIEWLTPLLFSDVSYIRTGE